MTLAREAVPKAEALTQPLGFSHARIRRAPALSRQAKPATSANFFLVINARGRRRGKRTKLCDRLRMLSIGLILDQDQMPTELENVQVISSCGFSSTLA